MTSNRPAGTLDAATALLPYNGPWNERLAAHLMRRAGFGAGPAEVAALAAQPMHSAVDGLIHFPQTGALPGQPELPNAPDVMSMPAPQMPAATSGSAAPPDPAAVERQKAIAQYLRQSTIAMELWWLNRMLLTPAPLQEKMTLFWHGHFTTLVPGKGASPQLGLAQNDLFRRMALGNIRELTQAVARDPAMLYYLDNARNDRNHPNENFARELMELYTLGIGNYTETDVRESARAFTGWRVRRLTGEFFEVPRLHDDGSKTFLGRTGNFDGGDIVDIIFDQPASSRWFARKLLDYFVYNDPEPELVEATAALLRKYRFQTAPVMSTLLRSNVFYSNRTYRALVKSPIEFVIGSYRLYDVKEISLVTLGVLNRLGQVPFRPPSVKGWDGGTAWLNSQALLTRENFATALVHAPEAAGPDGWLTQGGPQPAGSIARRVVDGVLQGDASPASIAKIAAYLDGAEDATLGRLSGENFEERVRGAAYLAMATPAYQLN